MRVHQPTKISETFSFMRTLKHHWDSDLSSSRKRQVPTSLPWSSMTRQGVPEGILFGAMERHEDGGEQEVPEDDGEGLDNGVKDEDN